MAALALAVDALVQAEDAEDVVVDLAREVAADAFLEAVDLVGDHGVERAGSQRAHVDRHGGPRGTAEDRGRRTAWEPGGRAAVRVRPGGARARHSSSRTSCGVRPTRCWRRRGLGSRVEYRRAGGKCQRISRIQSRQECRLSPRETVPASGPPLASGAMRMSALFLRTLRDDPADAEVDSHRLLVAGRLHPAGRERHLLVAAARPPGAAHGRADRARGDGRRRRAGDARSRSPSRSSCGSAPAATPRTGPLMFRLEDRKETGFCLSPTAEEVITTTRGGGVLELPRPAGEPVPDQLEVPRRAAAPLRAAPRPRVPDEGRVLVRRRRRRACARATRQMYDAYHARVHAVRAHVPRRSKAQAGEIGGDVNHEFMAVAAVGEDDFVWCTSCDYAANVEARDARRTDRRRAVAPAGDAPAMEKVHTPDLPGIAGVAAAPRGRRRRAAEVHRVRRRRRARPRARARRPRGEPVRARQAVAPRTGAALHRRRLRGPARPAQGLHRPATSPAPRSSSPTLVGRGAAWVTGANETDHHVRARVLGRDFHVDLWADLVTW